jgi:cell division septation protein DedD
MAARQTKRQLQFTGFEMSLIAVSFVVTVTSVFFLGLFVGRKNASFHAPAEDRVARVPVDDFTRYKRPAPIEKPPPKEKPIASDAALAAAAAPSAATEKPGAPAPTELAKAAAPDPSKPGSAFTPPPAPGTDAAAKPADVAAVDPAAKDAKNAKDLAAKDAAAKALADKQKKDALAKAEKEKKEKEKAEEEPTGRGYTVQILATRKQADADALLHKLKSRGYAAYIKKVGDGGGAWYRVRVGSYGAFGEARAMADRCRHDLGLGQAFVSTE